ncbi:MAG: porin [Nitrospirota bacterium]
MGRKVWMMIGGWLVALGTMVSPAQAVSLGDSGIDISGFVDVYYNYAFEDPGQAALAELPIRAFDAEANEFSLSLAELVIQKAPAPVGFRVDLDYGPTTDLVHVFEPGGGIEVQKHIQQAYLTYVAPLGKGLTIDAGKFVTHMGLEVIESKDNWNYTRGILFTWAIPFYHAGVRVGYPVADGVTVTLLAVNGWNNVDENNFGKTFGGQLIVTAIPKVTFIQNVISGPEVSGHVRRDVFDTVLILNATDKVSLALNFDYGQDDAAGFTAGDSSWYGVAGYGRVALTDAAAVAVRGEWFKDTDGFATGFLLPIPGPQTLAEVTVTGEIKLGGGLLTRLEYRHDWSNKGAGPFIGKNGAPANNQDTITLGAVYTF